VESGLHQLNVLAAQQDLSRRRDRLDSAHDLDTIHIGQANIENEDARHKLPTFAIVSAASTHSQTISKSACDLNSSQSIDLIKSWSSTTRIRTVPFLSVSW